MKKVTICQAAILALEKLGKPSVPADIFNCIKSHKLYDFKAKEPFNILKAELRKHTKGVQIGNKKREVFFNALDDGRLEILPDFKKP